MKKKISWVEALLWIVGSCFVFSCIAHKTIKYEFARKRQVSREKLAYVVQTGSQKAPLHSDYFCELLGLSCDKPTRFGVFNPQAAQQRLKQSPVIEEVSVKKNKPNAVYIDYSVRKPLACLGDFFNAALDREGFLFPLHPFFSPKTLPEICLGEQGLCEIEKAGFGISLKGRYLDVAFAVLDLISDLNKDLFFVKRVDVSQAFASSLGKREIVLVVENELYLPGQEKPSISTHFIRLNAKQYAEEIVCYMRLRGSLLEAERQESAILGLRLLKEKVVDLRLSQLAFIQ